MSVSTTNIIARASCLEFATYAKNGVADVALQSWVKNEVDGERRDVGVVHDCLAVLRKVDAPDDLQPDELAALITQVTSAPSPSQQRLGSTSVLVVELTEESGDAEVLRSLTGSDDPNLPGGELDVGGSVFLIGQNLLVVLCTAATSASVIRYVYTQLRMSETLRHKVMDLFSSYDKDFRESFLHSGESLRAELDHLSDLDVVTDRDVVINVSQRITDAFSKVMRLQGPVKQIQAMLNANLRNLDEANHTQTTLQRAGDRLFDERYGSLRMLAAQIDADLHLVQPVLEAAQCVAQSHHSQLLAELLATEAKENRQRAIDGQRRESQNLQFVILGLWIGLSQVWLGWIALMPPASRPTGWTLFAAVLVPTILGGLSYGITIWTTNKRGKS